MFNDDIITIPLGIKVIKLLNVNLL